MNISSQTLKRYLRNFDPLNQSLFKIDRYDEDSSYDIAHLNRYQNTERNSQNNKFTKQNSLSNSNQRAESQKQQEFSSKKQTINIQDYNQIINELEKKIDVSLKKQKQLEGLNQEYRNKIHVLVEHISSLQFENEQMCNIIKKNSKTQKNDNNSTMRLKKTSIQYLNQLQGQEQNVLNCIKQLCGQLKQKYNFNIRQNKICDSLKKHIFQKDLKISENNRIINGGMENIRKILHFIEDSFDQINFNMEIIHQLQEKQKYYINKIQDQITPRMIEVQQKNLLLSQQNKLLKTQIQKLKIQMYSTTNTNQTHQQPIDIDQIFQKIKHIIKIIVQQSVIQQCRQQIFEYLDNLKEKMDKINSINSLQKNLRIFQNAKNRSQQIFLNNSNGYKIYMNQLRFKKNLIQKQKQQLKKINQKIQTYYNSINSFINRDKQNNKYDRNNTEYFNLLLSQHKSTHQTHRNHIIHASTQNFANLTKRSKLFQQITSSKNQTQISRQNSLLNLKKKIQNAETLNRIISRKSIKFN